MRTMHFVIEDREPDGLLRDYQKYEITDPGHVLWFCHYLIRTASDDGIANAASALSREYVDDLVEHMRRVWPIEDEVQNRDNA